MEKLTGEVVSMHSDWRPGGHYWIDITLQTNDGHLVNCVYRFGRETVRNNLRDSLKGGMVVTVTVDGEIDLTRKFEYEGKGALRVHDRRLELETYVGEAVGPDRGERFSGLEVALLHDLVNRAKEEIRRTFDPTEEEMAKVEDRLDTLDRRTRSATKLDWKRLFISCIVGISVDLGFGSTMPEALFNLFKRLVTELLEHRLTYKNPDL